MTFYISASFVNASVLLFANAFFIAPGVYIVFGYISDRHLFSNITVILAVLFGLFLITIPLIIDLCLFGVIGFRKPASQLVRIK